MDEHELGLLREAARTADVMDELQKQGDKDGILVSKDLAGPVRPHPALVELRAQRLVYTRLIAALWLPTGVEGEAPRTRATKFEMGKLRGVPGLA